MSEARQRHHWSMLSAVLCMLANVNRDPKKHPAPYGVEEFDPFVRKQKRKRDDEGWMPITALKTLFVDNGGSAELGDPIPLSPQAGNVNGG